MDRTQRKKVECPPALMYTTPYHEPNAMSNEPRPNVFCMAICESNERLHSVILEIGKKKKTTDFYSNIFKTHRFSTYEHWNVNITMLLLEFTHKIQSIFHISVLSSSDRVGLCQLFLHSREGFWWKKPFTLIENDKIRRSNECKRRKNIT